MAVDSGDSIFSDLSHLDSIRIVSLNLIVNRIAPNQPTPHPSPPNPEYLIDAPTVLILRWHDVWHSSGSIERPHNLYQILPRTISFFAMVHPREEHTIRLLALEISFANTMWVYSSLTAVYFRSQVKVQRLIEAQE